MKIYALGPKGSNGEQVAITVASSYLKKNPEIILCPSHSGVFNSLLHYENVDSVGIVAVENSVEGLVREVVRDFWISDDRHGSIKVIGERTMRIKNCLLVRHGISHLTEVKAILSHSSALGQTSEFVQFLGVPAIPVNSTALAAQMVATKARHKNHGAIASVFAANIHGLKVLDSAGYMNIYPENKTRFHIVSRMPATPDPENRTACIFWVSDKADALGSALKCLGRRKINVSLLYPIPLGIMGEYAFYCEIDSCPVDPVGKKAFSLFRSFTSKIHFLGSFPKNLELIA